MLTREIDFDVSSGDLAYRYPSIHIVDHPLICTSTKALGLAGWILRCRQNIAWGKPKIRLYKPDGRPGISIKVAGPEFKNGPCYKVMTCPEVLFETLEKYNPLLVSSSPLVFRPSASGSAKEILNLKAALEVSNSTIRDLRAAIEKTPAEPPATIINGLQSQLVKLKSEYDTLFDKFNYMEGTTLGVKVALKSEIADLKGQISSMQDRLSAYENETPLETMQRLNRDTYEKHLARPSVLNDEMEQMERIFKTVNELLESIVNEISIVDKQPVLMYDN